MTSLAELKSLWDSKNAKRTANEFTRQTRGPDFVEDLLNLAFATGDARFADALKATFEFKLLDDRCTWQRDPDVWLFRMQRDTFTICLMIVEILVATGMPVKTACAWTAACFGIQANSFDAAVKKIERSWKKIRNQERRLSLTWNRTPIDPKSLIVMLDELRHLLPAPFPTRIVFLIKDLATRAQALTDALERYEIVVSATNAEEATKTGGQMPDARSPAT